jgi:hypothetical protein
MERKTRIGTASVVILLMVTLGPGRAARLDHPAACRHTWEVVPSPNPGNYNDLRGVAGLTTTDAWAVGMKDGQPLTLHWDGLAWSEIPAPSPGQGTAILDAVAAVAADDVWAVGYQSAGGAYSTLVEHWDGLAWSIVPSPPAQSPITHLHDVWAISSSDVWAVGDRLDANTVTLALHWDGVEWSILPTPNRGGANGDYLGGVSGVSATDVWAVGFTDNGVDGEALILHWAGSSWEIYPQAPMDNDVLGGVFALSPDRVWAVGVGGFPPNEGPLVERWDGGSWSVVPSSDPPGNFSQLEDVAALSSTRAWAVGFSSIFRGTTALLQAWQGNRWKPQSIPHVTPDDSLSSVSAVAGPQVWAVGQYELPSGEARRWSSATAERLVDGDGRSQGKKPDERLDVSIEQSDASMA